MMASQPDSEIKDLRIVLLGSRGAGKSWSGNTILAGEQFGAGRTAQCVSGQAEVRGRRLTVVDTPGWWKSASIDDTTELVKQELVCCASPGPQAFLFVVRMDVPFLNEHKASVKEHMGLLDERVWSHTVVLFTCRDQLGDKTTEQYIESEGKPLLWLIGKCGNRYHTLNNKNRGDGSQVIELLEKIEDMVTRSGGRCYEVDTKLIQHVEEMRAAQRDRAEQRRAHVDIERSITGRPSCLSKLRIVLLGHRTAGKSSSGNTILGQEILKSGRTSQCTARQRQTAGRKITVVDTPGWWANASVGDTSELVKQEIVSSLSLCPPGPHALLLVLRADIAFPNQFGAAILEHLSLISERVWDHTIVLFTRGDYLGDRPIEQYIESEGEALQWLTEMCGNRYHVFNNRNRSDGSQVTELHEKIEEMVARNGGRCYEIGRQKSQMVKLNWNSRKERKWRKALMKKHKPSPSTPLAELTVVLLGHRGSGKSSSGNTILGREGLLSGTTSGSVRQQGEVAGRLVTVVDTPGWCMTLSAAPVCGEVQLEIMSSTSLNPHAFLLFVRVDVSFSESIKTAAEKHLLPLTERDWSRVIVVFTHGDCLGNRTIEQYVESEGEALKLLVGKCGNRYHVFNNKNRGDGSQVTELLEKIEDMVAGKSDFPLSNASNSTSNLPHGSQDGLFFITPASETHGSDDPSASEPRASQSAGNMNHGGGGGRNFGPRWNRLPNLLTRLRKSRDDSEILINEK
ncbi:GTPase IMAP family member 8-like [Myripristis murdjan]|uniref:GTPase IMAP family member 8-like n=1 Tax=Myripristis murdjan TaxID=586833 RepID=UPI0011760CB2|nr:GTPase IMAP family member 8-like [Myripristis murdjan]